MTEPNIIITVFPQYLPKDSHPEQNRYVFAYSVTIENRSTEEVQLLTRHWIITNGETLSTQEVRGDGVIGKQPVIKPGEHYHYTSGTVMETPVGTMQGSYGFIDSDGQAFNATIAPFTLATTHSVH